MTRKAGGFPLADLQEPAASGPLYAGVYRRIREAILSGSLPARARLPSTRALAADVGVSRTTTEQAYAQLHAEGYLERRVGDGSYVAELPNSEFVRARRARVSDSSRSVRPTLSDRGRSLAHSSPCGEPMEPRPFDAGLAALDSFPLHTWNRLSSRRARLSGPSLIGYGDPAGYPPLREAVAAYLSASRGVSCVAEQVVILTSSQQALDLAARMLLDPGDAAWLEDPGYLGARSALRAAGAQVVPVPVDDQGLDVEAGRSRAASARLVYVTPSHQYPTGVTMSLERRLALLDWAGRAGAWVVEDDYDAEYRYEGRPIAAIQGLDPAGRVLYVGTFSKTLFPSIRLAYLVLPKGLVSAFVNARALMDGHTPQLPQAVLADFLVEGHFGAHLRKMRALYRERRDALVESVERRCGGRLRLGPADCGFHVAAYLPEGKRDVEIAHRAAGHGLALPPLSRYFLGRARHGFLLGFAGVTSAGIRQGAGAMRRVV